MSYMKAKAAGADDVKKFFEGNFKKSLLAFEKQANKDNSGCWIGGRSSLFDLLLYNLIHFFDDQESVQKVLEECPTLKTIHDKVEQIPEIKKWLEERPKTMF